MIELISSPAVPRANGHYSHAVSVNGFVFLSAQLPMVPGGGGSMPDGPAAQMRQVLANFASILSTAGAQLDDLVSVTIFTTDMTHWPVIDRAYAEVLGRHRPARGVVSVDALHLGALVAAQAIAAQPRGRAAGGCSTGISRSGYKSVVDGAGCGT